MKARYGLLLSFTLHATLLAALLVSCQQLPLPKPKKVEDLVFMSGGPQFTDKGDGFICDHFYIGIGVQTGIAGKIDAVADGYPASKVGIEVGDTVLNWEQLYDQHEGVREKLIVQKHGTQTRISVHPVPMKICII
jgi:hypothetical protein